MDVFLSVMIIVPVCCQLKEGLITLLVVIYARYSSENQSEESINAQLRACTEYCNRNGHTIVEHYIDRAMTARSDKRPSFQRMIQDAKAGKFGAVVVHKLDRFSRDRFDHAIYRQELRKAGVSLISVLENLDDSPESVVLESVLEGFSEYYSRNLARETRKGLKEIALQAKYTGGTILYGYDVDSGGKYIINETEAAVVRRIYDACYNRSGYDKLLAELRREGVRTKRGNIITKNTLYYILKNRRYCGDYIYSPEGELKYKKCQPIVIENGMPAIIERDRWNAVQKIMKRRSATGKQNARETYLLSGILYCGRCGKPMYGHRQKRRADYIYYSYECSTKHRTRECSQRCIERDRIETAVCNYVRQLISPASVSQIKEYMLQHMDMINAASLSDIARLEKQVCKIKKKIDKAVDILLEGDIPAESIKKKLAEMEDQKAILESKISQLRSSLLSPETLEKGIITCKDFDALNKEEKQRFIQKLIKKVTIAANDGHPNRCTVLTNYMRCTHNMEVPPRIELGIKELQSTALPLGYGTIWSG